MDNQTIDRRGQYFDEFAVGQRIISSGRTITESDVVGFAGISGDFNQIHTDNEFCKTTLFRQRVAHGLLILSIASGLAMRTGILEGTAMAFREIGEWKFTKPVFIGDTIHVTLEVMETKEIKRIGGGAVAICAEVLNQRNEIVMKGKWDVLVAFRP